jgi:enoyl-CoA hydratase/carnithine racemase
VIDVLQLVMKAGAKVIIDRSHQHVFIVQINRPSVRNAVDGETARLLHDAFIDFAEDDEVIFLRTIGP